VFFGGPSANLILALENCQQNHTGTNGVTVQQWVYNNKGAKGNYQQPSEDHH